MIKTLILKRSFDHPKSALVAGGHRFELYHPDHAEKSRKILYLKIEPRSSEINFEKVEVDANWDGLHGFFTHISEDHSAKIMQCYRGLWQIEEAFRVNKHSLKMRLIYHSSPRRFAPISVFAISPTPKLSTVFTDSGKKDSCLALMK